MFDLQTLAIAGHALSAMGAVIAGIVGIAVLAQSKTRRQLQYARADVVLLVLKE